MNLGVGVFVVIKKVTQVAIYKKEAREAPKSKAYC